MYFKSVDLPLPMLPYIDISFVTFDMIKILIVGINNEDNH